MTKRNQKLIRSQEASSVLRVQSRCTYQPMDPKVLTSIYGHCCSTASW